METVQDLNDLKRAITSANDHYNLKCRVTPFSKWYKGEHGKVMSALRRAVRKLQRAIVGDPNLHETYKAARSFLEAARGSSDSARHNLISLINRSAS